MERSDDRFEPVGSPLVIDCLPVERPSLGFWGEVWHRLKRNKLAIIGLLVVIAIVVFAVFGPIMRPFAYDFQNLNQTDSLPNPVHWFGTDSYGRDMWVRLWSGCRISLLIGFTAAGLDLLIGVIYGGVAAYYGGKIDMFMMRIVEVIVGVPTLILNVLMVVWMNTGLISIIIALVITGWVGMARVVRGQLLQLREREFTLAARALGAGPWRIIFHHLLPNMLGVILVQLTFTIPSAIFSEAFLSFLGLGVRAPEASLGSMIVDGLNSLQLFPNELFIPGITLSLIMFAFNALGDGLRDALDPFARK